MQFISVQPDNKFFAWQLEIQFLNFLDLGIDLSDYHVVVGMKNYVISDSFRKLSEKYPEVKWVFLEDSRRDKTYVSSIRPHLLAKYYRLEKKLEETALFYFDCDVIFRDVPNFKDLLEDDIIYLSDCKSYLNSSYINSKGVHVLDDMCKIVGITKEEVISIDRHCGGAQYLLKNLNWRFWDKVERDSTHLFSFLQNQIPHYREQWCKLTGQPHSKYHPLQHWTSDMWAVLWNLVIRGKVVRISEELDFSWATSLETEYHHKNIYHNAGVTQELSHKMFFKGEFIKGLDKEKILARTYDSNYASIHYLEYVKRIL